MARICSLMWLLLPAAAGVLAAPALKEKPPKEPTIIGEWVRVDHKNAGTPVGPDHATHHQVFSADGQWEYWYGARGQSNGSMKYVTDTRQSPPTIDIGMGGNGGYRGIYKVEGDTLTLCLAIGNRERPKTFESSADQPTTLWVFQRVKSKD
ncbi:MAG TPA: TIGR03067 domain-containing protein [Gemmataceae bacterium]|jgi:uncharacterized protein (TIGR03067 family)|nr:TIGR03067 domain-containing protein [Gemmataceae bacterium]